jgi:ribonucleoside-diphosphate reductase alpha chain
MEFALRIMIVPLTIVLKVDVFNIMGVSNSQKLLAAWKCGLGSKYSITMPFSMRVTKRDGSKEHVSFDKVLQRIRRASKGLSVNPDALSQQVLSQIYDGVRTEEIDELTAQLGASLSTSHPDWAILSARIAISNHQKKTRQSFSETMLYLSQQTHPKTKEATSLIHPCIVEICSDSQKAKEIDSYIQYERDFLFDYFGFKTLERAYLLKDSKRVVTERPQHLWMRVALAIWPHDLEKAFDTYDLLSTKKFTHATPTLFSAGTPRQQLSSCFLIAMKDDSVPGIFKTLEQCASISKYAGGIGLHIHNIRSQGSSIRGTNGVSDGIVPMLRVFNNTARYINQGGKRNGSFAVYLEPWHADVEEFLKLKIPTGAEEERARDLFYALWIPDLFMKRVQDDSTWSLFCPDEAPGLADVYGDEFEELYTRYEKEGRAKKTVSAQKLWFQILDTQMETGTPYLTYKDAANKKSNQKNLGTIKSSNLCSEVIQYSSPEETAVCNLASLSLPAFVKDSVFDFVELRRVTQTVIRNLNRVIDINFYPTPETETSNMRHRPVGLGVQGLADVFALLKLDWESEEAATLNQLIFEHMYYAAVEESCSIAEKEGSYSSFEGSPASQGLLQPDLWNVIPLTQADGSLDWNSLRKKAKAGMRNSLLLAPMPTASTSQILGNNECFEPFTSNLYSRRTLAGEFIIVNQYLMKELQEFGLWSETLKQEIIAKNGSVQGIESIPLDIQKRYKTGWEIKQRVLIDMAAARGAFICQSQSLNLFVAEANYAKLTSMHFHAWKQGLKTGCYYLRTKAPVMAQKFTVDPRLLAAATKSSSYPNLQEKDDDSDSDDDTSSDDEDDVKPTFGESEDVGKMPHPTFGEEEKKKQERREKLDRLVAEYEAEAQKAKQAAADGDGCLMCGS